MSAPDDFTDRMKHAYDDAWMAAVDAGGPPAHTVGLAAVEALVRADERDKIAREVEAKGRNGRFPFPDWTDAVARDIRRENESVPVKPEMTGWERRQLDAMEDR